MKKAYKARERQGGWAYQQREIFRTHIPTCLPINNKPRATITHLQCTPPDLLLVLLVRPLLSHPTTHLPQTSSPLTTMPAALPPLSSPLVTITLGHTPRREAAHPQAIQRHLPNLFRRRAFPLLVARLTISAVFINRAMHTQGLPNLMPRASHLHTPLFLSSSLSSTLVRGRPFYKMSSLFLARSSVSLSWRSTLHQTWRRR